MAGVQGVLRRDLFGGSLHILGKLVIDSNNDLYVANSYQKNSIISGNLYTPGIYETTFGQGIHVVGNLVMSPGFVLSTETIIANSIVGSFTLSNINAQTIVADSIVGNTFGVHVGDVIGNVFGTVVGEVFGNVEGDITTSNIYGIGGNAVCFNASLNMKLNDIVYVNRIQLGNIHNTYLNTPITIEDDVLLVNQKKLLWDSVILIGDTSTLANANVVTSGIAIGSNAHIETNNSIAIGKDVVANVGNGIFLQHNTSATPIPTVSGTVAGFRNGTNELIEYPNGSNGQVLTLNTGVPTWQTPASSGLSFDGSTARVESTFIPSTTAGGVDSVSNTTIISQPWITFTGGSPGGRWAIQQDGFYIWRVQVSDNGTFASPPPLYTQYLYWGGVVTEQIGRIGVQVFGSSGNMWGSFYRNGTDVELGGRAAVSTIIAGSTLTTVTITVIKVI